MRNHVLPEATHERALNKALEVAKLAVEELPKTGRVCKVLPDKLGLSGIENFGARRWALDKKNDAENTDLVEQFEAELKAANVEVLKVDDIVPLAPSQAVPATSSPLPAKPTTTTYETPNWAALAAADRNPNTNPTPSSTTTHSASTPNWAEAPEPTPDAYDNPFQAAAKLEQWAIPAVQVDSEISRYRCGVAERSVRRVKEMKPVVVAKPKSDNDEGPRSTANDGELTTRYAKVVLAPWNKGEWDDGGQGPAFRKASVIPPPPPSNDEEHNTEEGDITLLVEAHVLGSLSVGMGLAGTWVQLVPLSGGARGKGKSRKGKGGERFWYVEELAMGVPSFWTVAQEEEEGVCEDAYADF